MERDRAGLEKEEAKIEREIKKAAKAGNKEVCKILAKQLIQLRKQKTRTYQASAQINSISSKQKIMHANQKMAQSMGKTAQTMAKMNKQMDPQKMAKTLAQFERENMKMEMSGEMMDDAMDSAFAEDGDEEEADNIMNQVLSEIGIETMGQMERAPGAHSGQLGGQKEDDITDKDLPSVYTEDGEEVKDFLMIMVNYIR